MAKLIVANWKANPKTFTEALKLAKASDFKNVVIAPPYIYLQTVSWVLKKAALGAQDTFWENIGPYTGEVAPIQLKALKVKYAIIGHSERRRHLNETDEMIGKKVKTAAKAGLKIILCVGESWSTRRKGLTVAKRFVANQLKQDLRLTTKQLLTNKLVVAYEPVWAIGTGKADKPKDSAEIISYIKKVLATYYKLPATKILYGGSVISKNARSFLSQPAIGGALIGGASLKPKEFRTVIKTGHSL